jgi:hypothetical protein
MLTAAWSVWDDRGFSWRGDAGRIALAVAGGGAILGVGLLAALAGPARLAGDTSKDAYLRRIGAVETLRRTYLERFRQGWTRYAPWVTLPLAIAGALRGNGPVRRFLLSWAAFTVAAFAIVLVTRSIPPDRLLTFAFCVPLLAALGFVWVGDLVRRRTGRRSVAAAALALIAILAVFPALRAWISSPDFVDASEMRNAIVAGRVASLTPPGTPLVFVANDLDSNGLFHMAHVFNVARAAVPVDRVSDVHVFVGSARDLLAGRPTVRGVPNHDAASARTFEELPAGPWAVFVVDGLDDDASELDLPGLTRWDEAVASTVPPTSVPLPPPGADEPAPSTPGAMALAAVRTLIVLVLVGFGWGWWVTGETAGAAALATSFGLAVITIGALLADRLGAPIATAGWATIAIASAGGCGYALMIVRLRRARRSPDGDGLVRERGSGA